MIKFTADITGGGRLIGIGLSREDCERLLAHKPISLDLRKDLALPWKGEIVIMADENEKALTDLMRSFINEETIVHIDPRLDMQTPVEKAAAMSLLQISAAHSQERGHFVMFDFGKAGRFGLTLTQARALAQEVLDAVAKAESAGALNGEKNAAPDR